MVLQADLLPELRRHLRAVQGNVPHLATCQIKAKRHTQHYCQNKDFSKNHFSLPPLINLRFNACETIQHSLDSTSKLIQIMSQATPSSTPVETKIPRDDNRLVWVDMEMTGLDPFNDKIIEVAVVVTDSELNVLEEGPVLAIHQSDEILAGMDAWNTSTHGKSGLTARVKDSPIDEAQAEALLIEFLAKYIGPGKSPMCGNSICQDRRFMAKYMPKLEAYFHYRNLDVSTLKELCKRWNPTIARKFVKKTKHTALADIHESIDELRFYREHFIVAPEAKASQESPQSPTAPAA